MPNKSDEFPSQDFSGLPTPVCPACGYDWIIVPVKFCQDSYNVSMWGTLGRCLKCKTVVTACTPLDLPTAWKRDGEINE